MKPWLPIFLVACVIGASCRSANKELLVADTMKVVMWDMLKIDELYTRMMMKDTTLKNGKANLRLYEEVFALHRITKDQFVNTYKFYESHPIEFQVLLDSLENYASRERDKPGNPKVD